jgi:biofilm PGA synthesis N-glycosyltransferase PgaC
MKKKYILITPVHNEEGLIGQVIESVIAQTILPQVWIIVDDASTDNTGEIVKSYESQCDFLMYYQLQRADIKSYYSHRTEVFLAGYEKIRHIEHDFVAALDADLSLPQAYYENILKEFDSNPKLGIASGVYVDNINGQHMKVVRSDISTSGGLQVFRRECYEQIGGYRPLKYGGDDSLAEYTARMIGWQTRSFPAYVAVHRRPVGTSGGASIIKARFSQGVTDYYLGSHVVFMLAKSIRRCFVEKPFVVGGLARICGFFCGCFSSSKREISDDIVGYIRKEQIGRLFGARLQTNT